MSTPAVIFVSPRPREHLTSADPPPQVALSSSTLEPLFHLPQDAAAKRLGVSLTSLKAACQKIGIMRWPYSRWSLEVRSPSASKSPPNSEEVSNEEMEKKAVDVEDQEDDWLMQQMLHQEEEEGWLDWYRSCDLHDDSVWMGQQKESLKN
ncbi:hypothetical protein GUITHDRAFT_116603 [Guillardia theta CCMP2712]|uniref:RWP-RK domain-containing protein n=1 Tax=Guillardia theta (strain CCMP2712) TaxID=905079 RepID=L1ILP6_GUITC|nr:hypothetical protein GUITHDRAFT_116603 [Guillardia theta CCMP2712]EKX37188.1 hypothetical protein GUITHDRAFT_116603 [Guillardia theta CCMP2712]|eukprot:XP_005824168.1 hypothetical protein GUITHDRAFT_116603 [Guillardia theta CCMP2712]